MNVRRQAKATVISTTTFLSPLNDMISSVASTISISPAIAVASLTSIHRCQIVRSAATWFSSSVSVPGKRREASNELSRRHRSPRNHDITTSRPIHGMETTSLSNASFTDIEEIHRHAILDKQSTYIDPATGFTVFTELAHLKRGRCCGNQCRHCPYGWSSVRNDLNGGLTSNNAKAISGDSKGTGLLVKRILDGTYYENDGSSLNVFGNESSHATETVNGTQTHIVNPTNKEQGKGGSAGGALTSKNVPYTRTGDKGTAQLYTGERRNKDDIIFEALGTVDEVCSIVGVVYAKLAVSRENLQTGNASMKVAINGSQSSGGAKYGDLPEQLLEIMSRLFDVGSIIAKPSPKKSKVVDSINERRNNTGFNSRHTELLEDWIDTMTDKLPELTSFIIPTGSPASAQLHVARTVCRRAERRMVPLVHDATDNLDPAALAYVNRLSDYLFTAARFVNYCDDREEVQYRMAEHGEKDGSGRNTDVNATRERVVVKLKEKE